MNTDQDRLRVGLAQIAPVWLDRDATLQKMVTWIERAGSEGCRLVCFGESLVPGYPFWLDRTDGARFESALQKEIHALYLEQALRPERGDLEPLQRAAAAAGCAVVFGSAEAAAERGGHSLYCSVITLAEDGELLASHRKLVPTYEERLCWSPGDGHGLRTHRMGAFQLGALNCWENWMPLPRAALHALGEDLHVAVWPGARRNTEEITRFLAREGRSYCLSVSGLMRPADVPADFPGRAQLLARDESFFADGGSCVATPEGRWLIEPVVEREELLVAELDHAVLRAERQNFDPAGHYSRPDVTRLVVDRRRQALAEFHDED